MTALRLLLRALAVVLAFVWAVAFYGLIDLTTPFDAAFHRDFYLLETGWGLLFTVMVSVPIIAFAVNPALVAALAQLAAVAVTVLLAGLVTPALPQLVVGLALLATAGVLAPLMRSRGPGEAAPHRERPSRRLLAMAVLAGPPALWFARDMIEAARTRRYPVDITWGVDHWAVQAAFALSLPLVAALAATGWRGWRVCAWTAGAAAAWFGTLSVLWSDVPGGLGAGLGTAATMWGVLLIAVSERVRAKRRRAGGHTGIEYLRERAG